MCLKKSHIPNGFATLALAIMSGAIFRKYHLVGLLDLHSHLESSRRQGELRLGGRADLKRRTLVVLKHHASWQVSLACIKWQLRLL